MADPGQKLRPLLRDGVTVRMVDGIASSLPDADRAGPKRFEGAYGWMYDQVIQAPAVRRAIFGAWGSADPLRALEAFTADALSTMGQRTDSVLLDLPSGGGTLLPVLYSQTFRGTVVEADLAISMLARAKRLHDTLNPDYAVEFLRCDALDLPLADAIADSVVSINGLHVMPDHVRFLREIARVTKPGGHLRLITPVDGPSARSRVILRAARALSIAPVTPPTRAELRHDLAEAGFDEVRDYGGESIAGFGLRRRAK